MTVTAAQFGLTELQLRRARQCIHVVKAMNLPGDEGQRAADCVLATALVESRLRVYANRNNPTSMKIPHDAVGQDHGSVGILQQQVGGAMNSTADWGTTQQCMDINYSVRHFVRVLRTKTLDGAGWKKLTNGAACQMVQGSAFPGRYAEETPLAIKLRKALWAEVSATVPPKKTPPKVTSPAHPSRPVTYTNYTVKAHDSMSVIAERKKISLASLKKANPNAGHPRRNFDVLWVGDVLRIPSR